MRRWRVSVVRSWGCGPVHNPRFKPPSNVRDLGDGTFIAKDQTGRCFRARWKRRCGKCLPPGTAIATPAGDVAVRELRPGMPVWSRDGRGRRVAATVLEVSSVAVPADHRVVVVTLADGRSVSVSAGHPAVGGAGVEQLRAGQLYDGSEIVSVTTRAYGGERTYDLLPSGETGIYIADGVPLESTLR